MGRKSLAPLRRSQILDAFETSVAETGLDSASLADVAKAAGMDRHLVLHYFGSREALVEAAVERLLGRYQQALRDRLEGLRDDDRLGAFLDLLFLGDFADDQADPLLAELNVRARREPETRELLLGIYRELQRIIASEIRQAVPGAPAPRVREAAYLVLSLLFSTCDLTAIGFPRSGLRKARDAAELLVLSLVRS